MPLTQRDQDKMAAVMQTTFSWMKMIVFRFKVHGEILWYWFPVCSLCTISSTPIIPVLCNYNQHFTHLTVFKTRYWTSKKLTEFACLSVNNILNTLKRKCHFDEISSRSALEVVILTTFGVANVNDENLFKIRTFPFQWHNMWFEDCERPSSARGRLQCLLFTPRICTPQRRV